MKGQVPLPAPPPFQELPLKHTGQAGAWEAGLYGLVVFPCSRERRSPSCPQAGHLGDAAREGRRCSRRSRKTTRGRLCQRSGSVLVPVPGRPSPADPWGEAHWLPRFLGWPQGPRRPESDTHRPCTPVTRPPLCSARGRGKRTHGGQRAGRTPRWTQVSPTPGLEAAPWLMGSSVQTPPSAAVPRSGGSRTRAGGSRPPVPPAFGRCHQSPPVLVRGPQWRVVRRVRKRPVNKRMRG